MGYLHFYCRRKMQLCFIPVSSLDILPYSKIVLTYVFKLFWDLHNYDQGQCGLESVQSVLLLRKGICNGCLLPLCCCPLGVNVCPSGISGSWFSSSFQAPVLCGLTSWMERQIGNYASQWPAHRGCQLLQWVLKWKGRGKS